MKKICFPRLSCTGLLLTTLSTITALVLTNNKEKKQNGRLVISIDGIGGQLTCSKDQASGNFCAWTATQGTGGAEAEDGTGSRTSSAGKQTSSITTANDINPHTKTITSNPRVGIGMRHTSCF